MAFGEPTYIQPVVPHTAEATVYIDMDSDGDQDILVGSDSRGCKLGWFEQDEEGKYTDQHCVELPAPFPTSATLYIDHLILVDMDDDGDQDAVLGMTSYSGEIGWIEMQNGGVLAYTSIATSINYMVDLEVGDIDNDGDTDVAWSANNFLGWSANSGDGVFETPISLSTWDFEEIALADMNGDETLDLVASGFGLDWYPFVDGAYQEGIELFSSAEWDYFYCVDLNQDDTPDVLYQVIGETDTRWYPNLGDGTLDEVQIIPSTLDEPEILAMAPRDYNGDGYIDVLRLHTGERLQRMRNLGGTFSELDDIPSYYGDWSSFGGERGFLPIADVNGSGNKISYFTGGMIMAALQSYGSFCLMCGPREPEHLDYADTDGDGDYDLLATSHDPDGVFFYENNGDGSFRVPRSITTYDHNIRDMWMMGRHSGADMLIWANDGSTDIMTMLTGATWTWSFSNQYEVFNGDWPGSPTFYHAGDDVWNCTNGLIVRETSPVSLSFVTVDPLDGLGEPELMDGPHSSSYSDFHLHSVFTTGVKSPVYALSYDPLNLTYHEFCSEWFSTEEIWFDNPDKLLSIDLDSDGINELVVVGDPSTFYFTIDPFDLFEWPLAYTQNTNISFAPGAFSGTGHTGDLDDDGDLDLLVQSGASLRVSNYSLDGGVHVFDPLETVATLPGSASNGHLADLDEDGQPDFFALCNKEIIAVINYTGESGCMDVTACNFDPTALVADDSCCYGVCGCSDETAVNFNPLADCDDTCLFALEGFVYHDENGTGEYEATEDLLPFITVQDTEGISMSITNDQGEYQLHLPIGEHSIEVVNPETYPYTSTTEPVTVTFPLTEATSADFGLSTEEPLHQICVDFYPSGSTWLCNEWENYNICFRNMGNETIDGYIEVEYEFPYQDHAQVTPIDSVVGNTVYMGFEGLQPGQMFFYDLELLTPTVDHLDEFVTAVARAYGTIDGTIVSFGEEEITMQVLCAYDPNDKQVFPNGYTEDHLVLNDTELEYLVRFQNTGNAPAIDVLLRDTLDANLDLSTFQLMGNSHSVITTLDAETREVTFLFENIMLPDSTCCEEESHGLVSFLIRPYPDLEVGTIIENTAYIYFDNNEPIITNTTWNTIHACSDGLDLALTTQEECPSDQVLVSSNYDTSIDWETTFAWTFDDQWLGEDPTLLINSPLGDEVDLFLTTNNPLCEEYGALTVSLPVDTFWNSCFGDLNCDGDVDALDVIAFLGNYNCIGAACPYDMNGDAWSNSDDLLLILGQFGVTCD